MVAFTILLASGCVSRLQSPRHTTLERTVMVGYQGWFRTPNDGAGMGWAHYQQPESKKFEPGHAGIDFWPDVTELTAAEKVPTPFRHVDGSVAQVFSSHHPLTVERHFRWMKDYGIDGAFVQRFSQPIIFDDPGSLRRRAATDNILRYALAGAERHGRSLAIMYDLSGQRAGAMARVMQDWRHVVDDLKARSSRAYQHHRGKPVIAIWGIGFNDGRAYTLEECGALIDFLKNDPVYGGNTVLLGIPSFWRAQINDAANDERLHAVLQKADILSPWTPGRYRDLPGVRRHAEQLWQPDLAWCRERQLDYLPVVFPGFSWKNLKKVTDSIDRRDGRFLWEQYRAATATGATMIYQAMFDEMDEGTQIFKTTNTPPAGASSFATYDPLPSDYYLRLVGKAADHVRRAQPLPDRIPDFPGQPKVNAYLRSGDAAAYEAK